MKEHWVQHPAFQDILLAVRKAWQYQIIAIAGLIILLLTLLMFLPGWYKSIPAIGLGLSLWGIARTSRVGGTHRSPIVRLLLHDPEKIVWIYGYQSTRAPLGVFLSRQHRIFFQTKDIKSHSLVIPANRYLVVMKWLNRALPNAVFGWDDVRYQRWLEDGSV